MPPTLYGGLWYLQEGLGETPGLEWVGRWIEQRCSGKWMVIRQATWRPMRARSGGVCASPLAFWARELSEVNPARGRSLCGRQGGVRASPIAFCAREPFSASNCQESLVSRESSFPNSIPLLQDA